VEQKDLVVIGSGPGGHAAALRAAELGAQVALVEAESPGGNCVSFACFPNTVMLETVRSGLELQDLSLAGVLPAAEGLSFPRAVARRNQLAAGLIEGIRNHLRALQIDLIHGRARLTSPQVATVSLSDGGSTEISAASFIIATGARPEPPSLPGYSDEVLTMDGALRLQEAPPSALALGGGPVGLGFVLEQAFVLASFGTSVTVAEPGAEVLPGADEELVGYLLQALEAADVRVLTNTSVREVISEEDSREAVLATPEGDLRVPAGVLMVPDCRRPHFAGLGLGEIGVATSVDGIGVDDRCGTNVPGVFAVGDVTGGLMFSHAAIHQGRVAAENALGLDARVRLRAAPRTVHTQPELAYVGLSERAAREEGHDVHVGLCDLGGNLSAVARGRSEGGAKLVADGLHGEILGVHALGPGAGELMGQAALAMELEATVHDLAAVTHWHPSLSEALVEAARRAL
jgi:dihydrolipoamide dehydrogenase